MNLKEIIETRLQSAFHPTSLLVVDESAEHSGHLAHEQGARHFAIEIASSHFEKMTRIQAHRIVYALFTDLMPHPLHALKIKIL